jgi:hypothetical protein
VFHGATSSACEWRGQRRRDGQPWPTAQEPFLHRKKSLPSLRQKNACKWNYFTGSVGIRVCRDVFQKARPQRHRAKRFSPANRQSRRPDSNRGPLHYEGRTSRRRASTRGHERLRSRWKLCRSCARAADARGRACPGSRTRFVPGFQKVGQALRGSRVSIDLADAHSDSARKARSLSRPSGSLPAEEPSGRKLDQFPKRSDRLDQPNSVPESRGIHLGQPEACAVRQVARSWHPRRERGRCRSGPEERRPASWPRGRTATRLGSGSGRCSM